MKSLPTDPGPEIGSMILKIAYSGTIGEDFDMCAIRIIDSNSVVRDFMLAHGSFFGPNADRIQITDNGGEPQTIDLTAYGLSGTVEQVEFWHRAENSTFDLDIDYINFIAA